MFTQLEHCITYSRNKTKTKPETNKTNQPAKNQTKTHTKQKTPIFLILSGVNFSCLSSLIQRRESQGWAGDVVAHSQACSHDMSTTVIPSQLSQCRASRLPGHTLGYEHAAIQLSSPAAQPEGTARVFKHWHWGTSSPTLPHCKLTWYLALQ